jgi:fructose-bisphosphate aldolase class II
MPVADYETYCQMIDNATQKRFAYPAINVATLEAANGVLRGLSEKRSDGIIQVSTGGGSFASGTGVKDMALGAISLAEHVHRMAERYPVYVALHTDHCPPTHIESFLMPLIAETERRRAAGLPNLFNSHMFDGSSLPLQENLNISMGLLERCHQNRMILEIEVGVVGGEEDGISADPSARLYTTPQETLEVAEHFGSVKGARYLLAATFGNVHGVYKPGHVKLKPAILKTCQDAAEEVYGKSFRFPFVFHGGSGSSPEEIREAIDYGVVKMNVDTDTQYAFTRAVADHILKNYDGVLKVDGEVGNKKSYDPRAYLALAEGAMAKQVGRVVETLRSEGTTLFRK